MKKFIFIVFAVILFSLLISNLAFSQLAEVKVGKGTLKIGGIFQAGFTYNVEDTMGYDTFSLNRSRILLWGVIIPDKVKYFVQTDFVGSPGILDYKAQFLYIEKTEIAIGRFLPNFTLYMPAHTGKLEMINYPLTTLRYAVWRQVGIQSTTKTDYVDFNLGIFNGYPANNPGKNAKDNNDAFDFFGRVDFKPPVDEAQVRFGGFAWLGNADPGLGQTDSGSVKWNRFGGFAKADYKASENVTLRFRGEFLAASTEYLHYPHIDSVSTRDGQAFFAHFGMQPDPRVEFLARYDHHDPDKDMSYEEFDATSKLSKGSNSFGIMNDDEEAWLTIGVNFYLEGINSMFYLNFIHKMEPGDYNKWDSDQGKYVKAEREVDNDLIVGQVQIVF